MATLEASAPKLEDRLTIAARCAWSSSMFFQQPGVQDVKWNQSVIVVVEDNLRALEDYINVEDKDQYVFHLNAPNLPTCTFREKLNNVILWEEVFAALVDEMNELYTRPEKIAFLQEVETINAATDLDMVVAQST